ncbi:MAG TPA: hypothetical protein VGH28_04810 [Polyangiaceae bacterium]|jgi:hypothetical protein
MAKASDAGKALDGELIEHQKKVDNSWSPKALTALGFVTMAIAITLIVLMATHLNTCMYLDGSRP